MGEIQTLRGKQPLLPIYDLSLGRQIMLACASRALAFRPDHQINFESRYQIMDIDRTKLKKALGETLKRRWHDVREPTVLGPLSGILVGSGSYLSAASEIFTYSVDLGYLLLVAGAGMLSWATLKDFVKKKELEGLKTRLAEITAERDNLADKISNYTDFLEGTYDAIAKLIFDSISLDSKFHLRILRVKAESSNYRCIMLGQYNPKPFRYKKRDYDGFDALETALADGCVLISALNKNWLSAPDEDKKGLSCQAFDPSRPCRCVMLCRLENSTGSTCDLAVMIETTLARVPKKKNDEIKTWFHEHGDLMANIIDTYRQFEPDPALAESFGL